MKQSGERYYGSLQAQRLAAWLGSARSRRANPALRAEQRLALGRELLELGRTDEALQALETAALEISEDAEAAARGRSEGASPTPAEAVFAPEVPDSPEFSAESDRSAGADLELRLLAILRDAHLQAGEDQNCVLRHAAASCIVPFQQEALHLRPEHARRAADLSLAILERRPDAVPARWLLNLGRMLSGDYPEGVPEHLRLPEGAFESEEDFPWWPDRAPDLGIGAVDLAGGAVMDDFDGDGFLDLISSTSDHCDSVKAFRNDGRGGFEDVTDAWGLREQLGGLNLVHADYDGDGRLDLLVLRGGWIGEYGEIRKSMLRNEAADTGLRFVDVTRQAGIVGAYPTQTAAWADYDGDGDLDLYVGSEATRRRRYPSQLFRNEGNSRFTDVARAAGVENLRFAKGVTWGDVDDDGDPDLYVSNIGPNRLYRNEGDGTFTDVAAEVGVQQPVGRSFATWFFDYDNDGRLDLFVADYSATGSQVMASYLGAEIRSGHPLVYRNTGAGFEEVSNRLGITRPLLPMGANYGDIDNDGWLDMYLGTGSPLFEDLMPNVMLRNRSGQAFVDVTFAGGFGHLQKGHGVAFGDVDNDGDQDLFHQLGGFFPGDAYANAFFENPGPGANWVTLRLEGTRANRFGVGARIAVRTRGPDGARTIHVLAGSGGSFGGSSLQQEIGLGRARGIEEIHVRWPGSGTDQRFRGVPPNRIYQVVEGKAELRALEVPSLRLRGSGSHRHASAPAQRGKE